MKPWRKVGHNVIHLLYPIRWKNTGDKLVEKLEGNSSWQEMFDSTKTPEAKHYFSNAYKQPNSTNTFRSIIANEKVINFFHPSIQDTLFHMKTREFRAFQYEPRTHFSIGNSQATHQFYGKIGEEHICFEWLASELYIFSDNLAFLAVRVSLLENWRDAFLQESVVTMSTWMKFANRIRQNYEKYAGQSVLNITSCDQSNSKSDFFYSFVEDFVQAQSEALQVELSITQVIENEHCEKATNFKVEPNAFIHAFVTSDLAEPLSEDELYQIIHIDDYDGESGGTATFKQSFLQNNVYRRWENGGTYYTAIDYGAVTIANSSINNYAESKGENFSFTDLLYQHHCRQYLLLIVLQLYYREELQEILAEYSRLTTLNNERAQKIADDFYKLNQHFFFKRISQEIQGRELWQFYYRIFDIQSLLSDVQHDIQELNQRRIEKNTEKQSASIMKLTMITALTGLLGMNVIIPSFAENSNVHATLLRLFEGTVMLELWNVFSFFIFLWTAVLIGFVLWAVLVKK